MTPWMSFHAVSRILTRLSSSSTHVMGRSGYTEPQFLREYQQLRVEETRTDSSTSGSTLSTTARVRALNPGLRVTEPHTERDV